VLALEGLLLVAKLLRGFGSAFGVLGSILGLIGWSVIAIAATIGFGAFLMTRFRAEREPVMPASASLPPSPTPPPAI
jgi:hypothetical protein